MQMALENAFTDIANNTNTRTVILCDRGCMDGYAYLDQELWDALLDEKGWTNVMLRDMRYECVIHMVTAAIGAE